MGFFDALKRMADGKPVFENTEQDGRQVNHSQSEPAATNGATPAQPSGPKETPRIDIVRTESRMNGSNMLVTCVIQNDSQSSLDLDRLQMLGRATDLQTILRPGESRQINIYNGSRPNNMNSRSVELVYKKVEDTDAFQADFNIEYQREEDGTYVVDDLRLLRIRDV